MDKDVPPKDRKGLRTGFTTGACAASVAAIVPFATIKTAVLRPSACPMLWASPEPRVRK